MFGRKDSDRNTPEKRHQMLLEKVLSIRKKFVAYIDTQIISSAKKETFARKIGKRPVDVYKLRIAPLINHNHEGDVIDTFTDNTRNSGVIPSIITFFENKIKLAQYPRNYDSHGNITNDSLFVSFREQTPIQAIIKVLDQFDDNVALETQFTVGDRGEIFSIFTFEIQKFLFELSEEELQEFMETNFLSESIIQLIHTLLLDAGIASSDSMHHKRILNEERLVKAEIVIVTEP